MRSVVYSGIHWLLKLFIPFTASKNVQVVLNQGLLISVSLTLTVFNPKAHCLIPTSCDPYVTTSHHSDSSTTWPPNEGLNSPPWLFMKSSNILCCRFAHRHGRQFLMTYLESSWLGGFNDSSLKSRSLSRTKQQPLNKINVCLFCYFSLFLSPNWKYQKWFPMSFTVQENGRNPPDSF